MICLLKHQTRNSWACPSDYLWNALVTLLSLQTSRIPSRYESQYFNLATSIILVSSVLPFRDGLHIFI